MFPESRLDLTPEVLDAIKQLPQIDPNHELKTTDDDRWSIAYFVDQVLRNQLGLPSDYDTCDLELVLARKIVV